MQVFAKSVTLINRDLQLLRQQAKQNISKYIDEYLPAEYQYCLDALNLIVKEMWTLQPHDNRELMQSRILIKKCCAMRIDLLSNATVIDRAVKFVDNHINGLGRGLTQQNEEVTLDDTAEPIENTG
jgi:phage gp36-like protein